MDTETMETFLPPPLMLFYFLFSDSCCFGFYSEVCNFLHPYLGKLGKSMDCRPGRNVIMAGILLFIITIPKSFCWIKVTFKKKKSFVSQTKEQYTSPSLVFFGFFFLLLITPQVTFFSTFFSPKKCHSNGMLAAESRQPRLWASNPLCLTL